MSHDTARNTATVAQDDSAIKSASISASVPVHVNHTVNNSTANNQIRFCSFCQAALLPDGRCSAACFPYPAHVVGLPKHSCPHCHKEMALTFAKDGRRLLLNPRSGKKHVCPMRDSAR